jgi:hypothetical protein
MWEPWSRLLEALGRIRIGVRLPRSVFVGNPTEVDARGGLDWRAYRRAEDLFRVWGPVPGSPWEPFHCVPLFAALDRIPADRVGPTRSRLLAPPVVPGAGGATWPPPPPDWIDGSTWTIVDLPGRRSVEVAAWLVAAAGCQPVCTFDNWPHLKGLIDVEEVLAELLRWASSVAELRGGLAADAPPVWVCDSRRLGTREGRPGEYDNRYYLDDSILPGPVFLRRHGVERVVYLTWRPPGIPVLDLESYFSDLLRAGFPVLHLDLDSGVEEPLPLSAPARPRPAPRRGFRRSAAGGFGTTVPEPSSGGGGGG